MRINLEPILLYTLTGFPFVMSLVCLFYTFRLLKKARILEDTPTSKIRSAAQGYIELSGTCQSFPGYTLYSALSKKPCVWYRYAIEELHIYQTNEGISKRFDTLKKGASVRYIILKDDTGECLIDPSCADIYPHHHISAYGHSPSPEIINPPTFWSWLLGIKGRYRYHETYIEPNETLHANGYFQTLENSHPYIQQNSDLVDYIREKNSSSLHILTNQNLLSDQRLLLSTLPRHTLMQRYRCMACLFFIVFLFFSTLTVNSVYPVVRQMLIDWQKQQPHEFIPTP